MDAFSRVEPALSHAAFDAETASACVLDPTGHILAVNRAWDAFARANGGTDAVRAPAIVGRRLVECVLGDEPKRLAEDAFAKALRVQTPPRATDVTVHHMECNTAERYRHVAARFWPLRDEALILLGVLITYDVESEGALPLPRAPRAPDDVVHGDGLIHMCSGCRRTREPAADAWVFVAALVSHPDHRITYSYCPTCIELWLGVGAYERQLA